MQDQEKEMKGCSIFFVGFAIAFLFCLVIGILDKFGYLDPLLDLIGL